MTRYSQLPDGRCDNPERIGVLLVNSGTPDSTATRDVRRFLKNLLSDRRVVGLPRSLWLPILHGIILRTRPARVARKYRGVWTDAGSPLLVLSQSLKEALAVELSRRVLAPISLEFGMLYSQPSIPAAIQRLKAAGARVMLVLPLFPQYCDTTTGAVYDAVNASLKNQRALPELRFVSGYHDEPAYIDAVCASVASHWSMHGRTQHLVLSFHGIPETYSRSGDPYLSRCQETARLVAEQLGLSEDEWSISFQSKFGPGRWLQPYTNELLASLPGRGVTSVSVACPGFAVDSLETCDEIDVEDRQLFMAAGGRRFEYVPALNARQSHARALADVIARHCAGWTCFDLAEFSACGEKTPQRDQMGNLIAG